ncbi:MAG: polyprenol phosphomannose-dependent alpha 1,6 mannosyltransferase MptB [Acidimicrobiales bacterium]
MLLNIVVPDVVHEDLGEGADQRNGARSLLVLGALGFVASLAVTVGGALSGAAAPGAAGRLWSVPTVPVRPVMALVPALCLFYGGLIVLVRSWLLLRRHQLTHGLALGALIAIVTVWSLPLLVGPPLGSRDVYAYAAQGRMAEQGLDPYEQGPASLGENDPVLAPVDPLYRDAPVVYGPVFVSLSAAIARMTGDGVVAAVLAYRFAAVVGLVVTAVAVHDLARSMGRDPIDALVLAVANPLVLLHLVSGAHNEAIMLAFLVSGVAIGRRSRLRHPAIALCAMAAAIKLPAIVAVAFVAWPWVMEANRFRDRAGRAVLTGAEALLVIALAGRLTGWGWGWVDAISSTDPVDAYLSLTRVAGGGVSLATGLDLASVLAVARLTGLLAATLLTLLLLFRGYQTWPLALAWSLVIWAIMHPTTQPWYLTWGIMILAASSAGERNRSFVTGCAVAAFVVLPVGPQLGLLVLDGSGAGTLTLAVALLVALTFSPGIAHRARHRAGLDASTVSIVVPTRHEGPNIRPLLEAIGRSFDRRRVEVLFVDDSDDDTPSVIADAASSSDLDVRWVHRRPADRWGGLGGAIVDGLDHVSGSIVVVMDGDLQHPTDTIAELVATIEGGADLAVASRRAPGGSTDGGFTVNRRLLSGAATWLAWTFFPSRVGRISDPMSGYFAVRLGRLDLARLHPDGFKILVEILATHPSLEAEEVPYRFEGRRQGLSKASATQGTRYVGHLVDLRIRTSGAWSGAAVPQRVFRST